MSLELATAGESHGPALGAIVSGLPAGLVLDRAAIDADLRRRQQGYGRSPRQQIETDEVEVLAGLRHGRTLGTPLALVVRNRDHRNWTWGMSPWPPEGEPEGKGTKPVTLPRPGHADLAGVQKHGLADVRDALERASARHTAVFVAAGGVAKALLHEIGIEVAGEALSEAGADPAAVDEARQDRDTLGGRVEVRARGVPPGLGSYARRDDRLDARLAAAGVGIQAVEGAEIREGFGLAGLGGPLDRHVALVGFMGAGKTTIARALGLPHVETDADVPIELFELGEEAFRAREAEVVREVLRRAEPVVVDLGGGAVTTPEVRG